MLDFSKSSNGLLPVIIQNADDRRVLMLGYMNEEAYRISLKTGRVTFYSRSKKRLWVKGETSGNFLDIESMEVDCDSDALLVFARPHGPVCHTGTTTCFGEQDPLFDLKKLEKRIQKRIEEASEGSYTHALMQSGLSKMAQKVGEEAVELVIEAMKDDDELFLNEAADLMYHFLVLLQAKSFRIQHVEQILAERG